MPSWLCELRLIVRTPLQGRLSQMLEWTALRKRIYV